jgi:hypothetical protein
MITWSIKEMRSDASTGGVLNVCVAHSGQNGEKSDYRTQWFQFFPNTNDPGFVSFDQLTEATVLQWVFEKMGQDLKQHLEQSLLAHLGLYEPPQLTNRLPWNAK